MMSRHLVFTTSVLATAILFFMLGAIHARRRDAASRASYDAKLDAIRTEVRSELGKSARAETAETAGTTGHMGGKTRAADPRRGRDRMVSEIKEQLQTEMGLLPVHL